MVNQKKLTKEQKALLEKISKTPILGPCAVPKTSIKEIVAVAKKVRLKVGQLTGVKEDSFKETFAVLSKDTLLKGATLEMTFFPGTRIEVISFDVE